MGAALLIYGATGYTGKLVAQLAKERGLTAILAGRNGEKLARVAEPLGFDYQAVALDDAKGLDAALADVAVVLHIAGPFSGTSAPMLNACLRTQTHYVDITGEIDVFEAVRARDGDARQIMMMPGAGFDIVPTDCLAAHLKKKVPSATLLKLSLQGLVNPSRGTQKTAFEAINRLARVRRAGRIITLPSPLAHEVDFGAGKVECLTTGWGDVASAYYTTGIPNVEVYFRVVSGMKLGFTLGRFLGRLLATGTAQRVARATIDRYPEGPTQAERAENQSVIVGEVYDGDGLRAAARITTGNGYDFTAASCLSIATRVMQGDWRPGFQTPAGVYGADFILELDGCSREDLTS